jgi:hypothetical protein
VITSGVVVSVPTSRIAPILAAVPVETVVAEVSIEVIGTAVRFQAAEERRARKTTQRFNAMPSAIIYDIGDLPAGYRDLRTDECVNTRGLPRNSLTGVATDALKVTDHELRSAAPINECH